MATLWKTWFTAALPLRAAFSRLRTYLWFVLVLMAFSIRADDRGVTSFVRCLGMGTLGYRRLLAFFESSAFDLPKLTRSWHSQLLRLFASCPLGVNGKSAYVVDGVKIPKEGRRMPGVKLLHQESSNNSKAEYIMGHSCQLVSLLTSGPSGHGVRAVPVSLRIHEGVVTSNRDKRTLHHKLLVLLAEADVHGEGYVIADPYYANKTIMLGLRKKGMHLITRMKNNTVGYFDPPKRKGGRGRHRKYGESVPLRLVFSLPKEDWETCDSPVYDERNVKIRYLSLDLLWKPIKAKLRFVLVIHPIRGRLILGTTDLTLSPVEVIRGYGCRFKIEVGIKEARHTVGAFAYHFWMKDMDRKTRGDGDDHLHRKEKEYREHYLHKINVYHKHIQTGLIAQGLLQYLALSKGEEVWASFGGWLRTMNNDACPSEGVVANALKMTLPAHMASLPRGEPLKKIVQKYSSRARMSSSKDTG